MRQAQEPRELMRGLGEIRGAKRWGEKARQGTEKKTNGPRVGQSYRFVGQIYVQEEDQQAERPRSRLRNEE